MELRPYQHEAVSAVFAAFQTYNSALLVLPTGCGKTIAFAKIAEQFRPEGRTLVLAHREELLMQAQEKIEHWTSLKCGIEQAEKTVSGMFLPDVTIASVQSLSRKSRLDRFSPDSFGLLITDECHHAMAATYQTIYRYFAGALHLGVTATIDRADKKALGAVYETVAYSYDIRDAIEQGFLVPIRQQAVYVESLDFSHVRTTAGDLNEADLEEVLMQERNLHEVAQPTVDLAEDRPTLAFCTTVKHAEALTEVINRYKNKSAQSIDGTMNSETRARVLEDFISGRTQFLTNCQLISEGVDIPRISCISMARPTKSRALYCQQAGRGTRLSPETGKTDCIAEGELILTDQGLIPIEHVTLSMHVWDGENWVSHRGAVCRGEQEVISYAGLTATPDHKVWTQEGWKTFGKCAAKQIPIAQTGHSWQSLQGIDGHFCGNSQEKHSSISYDRVCRLWRTISQSLLHRNAGNGGMSQVWQSSECAEMVRAQSQCRKASMYQPQRSTLQRLRSAWHRVSLFLSAQHGTLGARTLGITQTFRDRPNQQQWPLRTWESSLFNAPAKLLAYAQAPQCVSLPYVPPATPRSSLCRQHPVEDDRLGALIYRHRGTLETPDQKTKRRVWDLLNAGPLHRFTASNLLVSNCLILDFVGNSGQHSLVCALDIVDGNMDLEVKERAQTLCLRNPDLTVLEALEQAAAQLVEEKRAAILVRARFQTVDVDPFVVLGVQPRAGRWSEKEITPEQIDKLERHKIPWQHLDAGQAEEVLRVIRKRVQDGLCSVRQGRQLMRFGLSPDVRFAVASKQMDMLASAGWRPTLAQLDAIRKLAA